jgi:hypothetical protein
MTAWTDLVSAVYKEKHSANPDYKFKDAMKDAKKQYNAPTVPKNKSNKLKKSNKKTRSRKGSQKRDSRKKK